jgi:hypothetical protein
MMNSDPLTRDIATRLAVSLAPLDVTDRENAMRETARRLLATMLDDGIPMLDAACFVGAVTATAQMRLRTLPGAAIAGSA